MMRPLRPLLPCRTLAWPGIFFLTFIFSSLALAGPRQTQRIDLLSAQILKFESACNSSQKQKSAQCQNIWSDIQSICAELKSGSNPGSESEVRETLAGLANRVNVLRPAAVALSCLSNQELDRVTTLPTSPCTSAHPTRCWATDRNTQYFVTTQKIWVAPQCFSKDASGRLSDSNQIIPALTESTHQIQSCLRNYSPYLANFIQSKLGRGSFTKPTLLISCYPSNQAENHECASHSYLKDSGTITLHPPYSATCGSASSILFHELLHFGQADNLVTKMHNERDCEPVDSVFACSELCYGSSFNVGFDGCTSCLNWGRNDTIRGRTFDIDSDSGFRAFDRASRQVCIKFRGGHAPQGCTEYMYRRLSRSGAVETPQKGVAPQVIRFE